MRPICRPNLSYDSWLYIAEQRYRGILVSPKSTFHMKYHIIIKVRSIVLKRVCQTNIRLIMLSPSLQSRPKSCLISCGGVVSRIITNLEDLGFYGNSETRLIKMAYRD